MHGDVIDRRDKFGVIFPHAPDLTGRHRNRALALHPLDRLDEPGDGNLLLGLLQFARPLRLFQVSLPNLLRFFRLEDLVTRLCLAPVDVFLAVQDRFDDLVARLHLSAVDDLVADHERVDVAVLLGEIERRAQLLLVALLIPVEPRANCDAQIELGGNAGDELDAAG